MSFGAQLKTDVYGFFPGFGPFEAMTTVAESLFTTIDDILPTDAFGLGEDLGTIGVEDDLQQALTIAQIDEDDAAVVASPVHPAANGDLFADQALVYLSAIMAAHGSLRLRPSKKRRNVTACGLPLQL